MTPSTNLSRKVLDFSRKLSLVLLSHLNAIAFAAGFTSFGYGVSLWSLPAAFVLAGSVLMAVACWPYVRLARRKPQ